MNQEFKEKSKIKQLFLIGVLLWLFFGITLFFFEKDPRIRESFALSEGDWLVFYKSLFASLEMTTFFLPLFLALVIGSYLSLKRKKTPFSFEPLILFIIVAIPFNFYLMILSEGGSGVRELLLYNLALLGPYYLISFFFHRNKEKLLLKITTGFLFLLFLGSAIGGKILADKYSSERKEFEKNINSLYSQAINELNPYFCEKIIQLYQQKMKTSPARKALWSFVAANKPTYCITKLAQALNDISLCKKISEIEILPGSVNRCLVQVALKGKIELCDTLEPYEHCLMKISNRLKDEKICKLIESPSLQSDCIELLKVTQIAFTTKDPNKCQEGKPSEIERIELWNKCILEIAFRMNNPKLCDLMKYADDDKYESYWDKGYICKNQPFKNLLP